MDCEHEIIRGFVFFEPCLNVEGVFDFLAKATSLANTKD